MKILTVIGARPQIIKAAALSRAIKNNFANEITEYILHTGQHYDKDMSSIFFSELGIPQPDINLNVGSEKHGKQTALMIEGIEKALIDFKPDYLVLYGDTNSTLAGAIAASKLFIPIVHIEAGLRSFNKSMPEEINRILCDHCSTLLFSPTTTGITNLENEGFKLSVSKHHSVNNPGIFHCGDIMYDNSLFFAEIAEKYSNILTKNELEKNNYILATIHRNQNTDNKERLQFLFDGLCKIAIKKQIKIILPLHPRTRKMLTINNINIPNEATNFLKIISPASFLEMTLLEKYSKLIMTDSGGVQKEAFFFKKPAIILRPETEWIEIIEHKAAQLVANNLNSLIEQIEYFFDNSPKNFPEIFGDGHAAEFICQTILNNHYGK